MVKPTISEPITARPGAAPTGLAASVSRQERSLLGELAAGTAVSAVGGAVLWVLGRRSGRDDLTRFGRQSLAWAAVDAAIVGWGRRGLARPPTDQVEARGRARRMRRLTLLNAVADVGYVAVGAAFARGARRRGDGLAVVVQGLFLLWLDTRHTRRFRALACVEDPVEELAWSRREA